MHIHTTTTTRMMMMITTIAAMIPPVSVIRPLTSDPSLESSVKAPVCGVVGTVSVVGSDGGVLGSDGGGSVTAKVHT